MSETTQTTCRINSLVCRVNQKMHGLERHCKRMYEAYGTDRYDSERRSYEAADDDLSNFLADLCEFFGLNFEFRCDAEGRKYVYEVWASNGGDIVWQSIAAADGIED